MKKYIFSAGILLAISFSSCEDFLTVESPDQLTTDAFWRNEKDAEAGLASAYAQLYHGDAYATSEARWPVEAYRTDLYEMGHDALNYDSWVSIYNFSYTNGNEQFSYYYQDLYRGINFINQVLINLPNIPASGISDERRNILTSEAHFLRGYYHLMLLLNWEKIIIRNEFIQENSQINKPLSDRITCWDFVIEELKQATSLPAERTERELGRATSGAANAYLGLAYLTRAYEESAQKEEFLNLALKALNEVKGYELVKGEDLINMFNGHNKNCKESIFEIQYSKATDNGAKYFSHIHHWIASSELGGWDEITASKRLYDEFKKEGKIAEDGLYDARLYNTLYFQDEYWNDGTGKVLGQDYKDRFWQWKKNSDGQFIDKNGNIIQENELNEKGVKEVYDRPVFRKFTPATLEELEANKCAFNIPLMRYANVLLMKAEVLNEQGHPEQAIPIINDIRDIHGNMPAMSGSSQEAVRSQIEHERIIEFPLESYRWYDLRRWNKQESELGKRGFVKNKHSFYPIPLWEINANELVTE